MSGLLTPDTQYPTPGEAMMRAEHKLSDKRFIIIQALVIFWVLAIGYRLV